jgi:hypothetical protein
LRWKNHISTFIFGGTFIFQIFFLRYFVLSFRTFKYMHLIVYPPKAGRLQTKTSIYYASLLSEGTIYFQKMCERIQYSVGND